VAALGLVLGHWLTYELEVSDAHARAEVLSSTGHAYLGPLSQFAVVAAIAALAALFLGRLVRPGPRRSLPRTFAMLATFQVIAFVAMEVAERVAAGAPVGHLAQTAILPVGALLQIAIAFAGAFLIRWVLRTAERMRALVPFVPPTPTIRLGRVVASSDRRPPFPRISSAGIRGPPVTSGA
jgi:hypothetical protein